MESLYQSPKYYEIAFSFRDINNEVDMFEESIRRYSRIPVKTVFEIGCGNSPHMPELVNRGYDYVGIDLSEDMIKFSEEKSKNFRKSVSLIQANMVNFNLDYNVDFAYIPLGSLYITNNDELNSHFDSVGKVLRKGGLYFLDWCIDFNPLTEKREEWEMEQDGIVVRTQYYTCNLNKVSQTYEENIILDVDDNGRYLNLVQRATRRSIYPQEFLFFLENRDDFEFIGWWNDWNLESPLQGTEEINRPIVIVRKK